MDEHLFRELYGENGSRPLLFVMIALTALGSGWTMLALIPLVLEKKTRGFALRLGATLTATGIVVFLLKETLRRTRPCNGLPGVHGLFGTPSDFSCPSGHAAGSFAFAMFVAAHCLREARIQPNRAPTLRALSALLLLLAAAIAFSRVYLGVHYPGDVLAGALLGGATGFLGAHGRARRLASDPASDTE